VEEAEELQIVDSLLVANCLETKLKDLGIVEADVVKLGHQIKQVSLVVLDLSSPLLDNDLLEVVSKERPDVVSMVTPVLSEDLAQLNDVSDMEICHVLDQVLLPVLESPSLSTVAPPVPDDGCEGIPARDVFLGFDSLFTLLVHLKPVLHQLVEIRIIHSLFGHMIHDKCPFNNWDICLTSSLNLVHIWLDSTIDINTVVVEEKWVLSVVSKILDFRIVSPFMLSIDVVKVSWFKIFLGLFLPHRV